MKFKVHFKLAFALIFLAPGCASIHTAHLDASIRQQTVFDSNKADSLSLANVGLWVSCKHDQNAGSKSVTLTQEIQNRSAHPITLNPVPVLVKDDEGHLGQMNTYTLNFYSEASLDFPNEGQWGDSPKPIIIEPKDFIVLSQNLSLRAGFWKSLTGWRPSTLSARYSLQDAEAKTYFWELKCTIDR